MFKTLSKVYSTIVNLNQWFTYGRNWLLLPFTVLSTMSSVGILIIYFGWQQSVELLTLFTFLFMGLSLALGIFLFRSKGQQVEEIMAKWRNPLSQLEGLGRSLLLIDIAEKLNVPVPDQLRDWGVKDWDDMRRMNYYILQKGERAYAKSICRKFFGIIDS